MRRLIGTLLLVLLDGAPAAAQPAPTPEASCRDSEECREVGRCERGPEGCVARSRADCERSLGCRQSGLCTPFQGECAVRSSDDCKRSSQCKEAGRCLYRAAERGRAGRPAVAAACVSRRELKCNCPPPGHPSGMAEHQRCLERGGGWGPHCGAPRP